MEVVYQNRLKGERPSEDELNFHPMFIENTNTIPQKGDYLEFADSVGGENGIYKVVSRYFQYFYHKDKYDVRCNIVVERDDDAAPKLIKQ